MWEMLPPQQPQQQQQKDKFEGNWPRSFKHGSSVSKLLHEYPTGLVHMDGRRGPAVLLLIKTVVIPFPILLEQGLRGAAAWRAENASSRLREAPLPATEGWQDPHPLGTEGVLRSERRG